MTPEEKRQQALQELNHANEVRLNRARILRELNAGKKSLEEVLESEWCQSATVFNVVRKQHRWARQRTLRLLAKVGISETREVRQLTPRQRAALLAEVSRLQSGRSVALRR